MKKGIIRILQSLMGGGGIIRILQSLMGGGIIRILQSLMGGIIRILQSIMGYQVNFIGHNQKPPTHPQAINCDRSLRDEN